VFQERFSMSRLTAVADFRFKKQDHSGFLTGNLIPDLDPASRLLISAAVSACPSLRRR
jgi:hypothetical protein